MYDEEMYDRAVFTLRPASEIEGRGYSVYPQTYDPCSDARTRLCQLDKSWCNATCDQIKQHVCADPTIFVGNDPVRIWANCGGTSVSPSDNMLLYVAAGGVALIAVIAVLMATRRPRRLTVK